MTNYTVRVERVAEYTVEAESEDAAIALVRRCRLESNIRDLFNAAINTINNSPFPPDDGVFMRTVYESHSASRTRGPIV